MNVKKIYLLLVALFVSTTLLVSCGGGGGTDTVVVTPLDFTTLPGTWNGIWHNITFGSTGSVSIVATADIPNSTGHAVLTLGGNVFGAPAPGPVTLDCPIPPGVTTLNFSANGTSIGDIVATITGNGRLTADITGIPNPLIEKVHVNGTVTSHEIDARYTVRFSAAGGGGTAEGVISVTK